MSQTANTIDITPTWGEWANIYRRLAETGETKAVRELRADFAKAMAAAAALNAIRSTFTDEQAEIVSKTVTAELEKQGY
ncbi:TPA: hypothetical protein L5B59_006588 [Pseudomonas aeruginosa]|nr:MOL98_26 [Synthetic plasmid pMOL98]HBO8176744.1 hypothetical protein [Pseudomonas aeruginosa]